MIENLVGIDYFNARFYQPRLGRFNQGDPLVSVEIGTLEGRRQSDCRNMDSPGHERELFVFCDPLRPGAFRAEPSVEGLELLWRAARAEHRPSKPIALHHSMGNRLLDLIWAESVPMIHQRVLDAMVESGITGWTTFPVEIARKDGTAVGGYSGLAVTGRCSAVSVNKDSAAITYEETPHGKFAYWTGLKIAPDWDGADFFTGADDRHMWTIATQCVRSLFARLKVSNCEFCRPEEITLLAYKVSAPDQTSGGDTEVSPPLPATEAMLSAELLKEVAELASAAARTLGVSPAIQPDRLVEAICQRIEDLRPLQGDRLIDETLQLGCLWGEQVRRSLGWEWVEVTIAGETGYGVVSRDRALVIFPTQYVKALLEHVERDNTATALFNMVVAGNVPAADPGAYLVLG